LLVKTVKYVAKSYLLKREYKRMTAHSDRVQGDVFELLDGNNISIGAKLKKRVDAAEKSPRINQRRSISDTSVG